MEDIYSFSGRKHPFSNFYPAGCVYEGVRYANGESAFQAAKTLDPVQRKAFEHIEPGDAKRLGRSVELRKDWEDVKFDVMLDVLRSKFKDAVLRSKLLDTGSQTIVEDTTGWHDNIWGICSCGGPKCCGVKGQNLLGLALMQVREEIRNEGGGRSD